MTPRLTDPSYSYIADWVNFGKGCIVHPFAYIGKLPSSSTSLARWPEHTKILFIGDYTEIGPHSTIYSGSDIGSYCLIGDGANIREGVKIGNKCIIGCNVNINYDVEIADEVRIMTGTFVTDGCRIGQGTFIGINVTMMSDKNPQGYEYKGSDGPHIGENCLIGSGAILMPGIKIGSGAIIGAGALVTTDVPAGAIVLAQRARMLAQAKP